MKPGETVTCDFTYVKRAALTLTKTVSGGNDLRSGPVEIELTCDASALSVPGDWPKTLSLPTGQSSGSLEPFYVDGDANGDDTCHATETANGAGEPKTRRLSNRSGMAPRGRRGQGTAVPEYGFACRNNCLEWPTRDNDFGLLGRAPSVVTR